MPQFQFVTQVFSNYDPIKKTFHPMINFLSVMIF